MVIVFLEFWRIRAEAMWRSHVSDTPGEVVERAVGDGETALGNGVSAIAAVPWGVGAVQRGVETDTSGPSRRRVAAR